MTKQERLSAFMQFAEEDIKTVRKEGAMSITDTCLGPIHLTLLTERDQVNANIPKYGWEITGPDQDVANFLTQVYRIIEE